MPAVCKDEDQHGDPRARHGKAVADREEVDEPVKADGAERRADGEEDAEVLPAHISAPPFLRQSFP